MKLIRSAKIVVLDSDGKALLLRRSGTHPRDAFKPDIPGGVIEPGEAMETGLIRELFEETGLVVSVKDLVLVYSVTFDTIPGISINRLLYAVRIHASQPDITISWEHDQFHWVDITDLKDLERPYQKGVNYANKHQLWSDI